MTSSLEYGNLHGMTILESAGNMSSFSNHTGKKKKKKKKGSKKSRD